MLLNRPLLMRVQWFVETMVALFEAGGDEVDPKLGNQLIKLVGEAEEGLQAVAVAELLAVLDKPRARLPEVLLQACVLC